ncbi:XRE family transcriptional regulator [Lapidilactobacillus mulanensis]|uniref:XRE family transcriptional regulator n=1 Tax=Lapidilactobacillus mulanensis TaxID=2485999 RepID=A0ABW4DMH6_9LACO|nr:helix-turn-helix transcriptional regulator [Lapidilactobacillus mulanensis]
MNLKRLQDKIVEQNLTQDYIAQELGINKSTLYRKVKRGTNGFTIGEVGQIKSILELSTEETMDIFFED